MDNSGLPQNSLVSVQNLSFSRGNKKIFDDISLEFERGKITAIMGPSGTGKTTLLKLIGGQLFPEQGTIIVDGNNVHRLRRSELYNLRKRMGMLFQSGALLTDMNVFDNVAFPLREHTHLPESMIRTLVLMKLQAVGLRGARNLMPNELSGGMARRIALARAIALDPMMIMYDEPFTGQDPISKGALVHLIKSLNTILSLTSIVVSHDVQETAAIADYIYVISEGKIVGQGTPKEIEQSDSDWVQQFMTGAADGPAHFHYPAKDYVDDLLSTGKRY
ncbi:MAG: ATP-binding cassette domain-containing protein [Methylobacter sp.]|uniref:ATP-binding cassette domain-containing protein n=1 Tax=Methylobacter sp. TaxID=2051955 RepID=UPI002727AA34|nr:ATP-binding cassette domain-containing protein [Methylobacter sp.]MDO9270691.1 ATP-binding cassette domain-containing protein [Methylobacter sp.]MDP1666531.1 ATP-binding cassette domain-containing protein [Methylobacter sp.]MDP1970963.1 ATP-binding cassette domain-containing protein [Methylobacter sp.]